MRSRPLRADFVWVDFPVLRHGGLGRRNTGVHSLRSGGNARRRGVNLRGQVTKGVRGMSWRRKAMKGVEGCEKPGGAVKRALIPGFPNDRILNP
jgi:hypothetical protein